MKNNILITGHKGFLGHYLYSYLKKNKKNKLIGKDIDLYTNNVNYKKHFLNTKKKELIKIDTIIHLAGISTNYDPKKKIYKKISYKNNYLDTIKLANLAKKFGVKKFIFASSTSVYGDKNNKKVNENEKLEPVTSYGKSKKYTEEKLKKISSNNFKVIILRMATLFGLSKRMRFDLLVNNLVLSYIKNGKIILLSDGKKIRPQVHIKDVVKVYDYFVNNEIDKNYLILNTGRDDLNLTVAQVAKKIASTLKCKIQYGKIDKDKRSYKVNFKKLSKYIKFNKKINTIEKNTIEIKKFYKNKKIKFFQNKNFYNLNVLKYLIDKNEINKILL